MKTILLHGPGEIGKRTESLKIRKSFGESVKIIDLKQNSSGDLEMALVSTSLFETGPRLVVVENPSDSLDLETLKGDELVTLMVMAATLKADTKILKSAQKIQAKLIVFEGEKELSAFPYLDALIEGKKQAFTELNKLLAEYGGVYVLTMIYYLLRRNFLPQSSSFMQNKVRMQKQRFNDESWEKLYRLVLKSDYALKTGLGTEETILTTLTSELVSRQF